MDKCRVREPGEYMMDIGQDTHLAMRHFAGEPLVEQCKVCFMDKPPLFVPSLSCEWCTRWCNRDADALSVIENPPPGPKQPRGGGWGEGGEGEEDEVEPSDESWSVWCQEEEEGRDEGDIVAEMAEGGKRHGAVLGRRRPWCPPGYIEKVRREFPTCMMEPREEDCLLDPDVYAQLFEDTENLQGLVDGGIDLEALDMIGTLEDAPAHADEDEAEDDGGEG
ncbi:hypothetical protein T484DRAFT_1907714 [Baffinella frigidus]|nr:hypothetical protein T484DRAFT_1907714 [Cryptophyta sp. CCMP2293]